MGYILIMLMASLFAMYFLVPSISFMVPVVIILAIPASADWITQSWGFRRSDNRKRIMTGLLLGAGIALVSLLDLPSITKYVLVGGTGSIVILAGYLGKTLRASADS